MPQRDKARIAPVLLEQGRIEGLKHTAHQPGVFLLLLDEQIDGRPVNSIASPGGPRSEVSALPAFTQLEALQRADQRFSQGRCNLDTPLPWDSDSVPAVGFEIIQPIHDPFLSAKCCASCS